MAFILDLVEDTDTGDVATVLVEEALNAAIEAVLVDMADEEVTLSSVKENTWLKE